MSSHGGSNGWILATIGTQPSGFDVGKGGAQLVLGFPCRDGRLEKSASEYLTDGVWILRGDFAVVRANYASAVG